MMFKNPMPRALTVPGLCGLVLVAAVCLSWSPLPASVLAQDSPRAARKPSPPADVDPDEAPPTPARPKAKQKDQQKNLQNEVDRLEREIADTLRELKEAQLRARAQEDARGQNGGRGQEGRADNPGPGAPRGIPQPDARGKERGANDQRGNRDEAKDKERRPQTTDKKKTNDMVFELQLRGQGDGRADLERRMSEVERKLDTILWTLTEIRRGQSGIAGGGFGGGGVGFGGGMGGSGGGGGGRGAGGPPAPPVPPVPPTPPGGRGGSRGGADAGPQNPGIGNRPFGPGRRVGEEKLPPPKEER
jgi:hypothetical protein